MFNEPTHPLSLSSMINVASDYSDESRDLLLREPSADIPSLELVLATLRLPKRNEMKIKMNKACTWGVSIDVIDLLSLERAQFDPDFVEGMRGCRLGLPEVQGLLLSLDGRDCTVSQLWGGGRWSEALMRWTQTPVEISHQSRARGDDELCLKGTCGNLKHVRSH